MSATLASADRTESGTGLAAGGRAMVPWLAGIVPFGLVIGVSAAQADIPAAAGWLTGPTIYAGSAQAATIEMLDAGAAPVVIVVTALVINLRLILYSGAIASHWRGTRRRWRMTAAYLLVDPSFVVGMSGYQRYERRDIGHRHYIGGAVVLWLAWLAAIGVGVTLGAQLPSALQLDLIVPLYLLGEVVGRLGDRATRRAAGTAAIVAVAAFVAPLHLGILLAIVAGLGAALTVRESAQ